jgi:hypothetical protein
LNVCLKVRSKCGSGARGNSARGGGGGNIDVARESSNVICTLGDPLNLLRTANVVDGARQRQYVALALLGQRLGMAMRGATPCFAIISIDCWQGWEFESRLFLQGKKKLVRFNCEKKKKTKQKE